LNYRWQRTALASNKKRKKRVQYVRHKIILTLVKVKVN